MKFQIITPEKTVYSEEIDQLTLPTKAGEITVLPHHIPLVSALLPGELCIKKGKEETPLAISGGFLEVRPDKVVVLADTAELVEEIDEERAEKARKRAEEVLTKEKADSVTFADATAALERSLARIKLAKKYRNRRRKA